MNKMNAIVADVIRIRYISYLLCIAQLLNADVRKDYSHKNASDLVRSRWRRLLLW